MTLNRRFVSEVDTFINNLLQKKPQIKETQKRLRSTWWDKDFIDNEEQQIYKDISTPKHGYAYFDYSSDAK